MEAQLKHLKLLSRKMLTEQEWMEEWKKTFPKSLLQEKDFDELLNSPSLKDNKNASIKFIKDHSFGKMGLKSSRIYYEVWIEGKFS